MKIVKSEVKTMLIVTHDSPSFVEYVDTLWEMENVDDFVILDVGKMLPEIENSRHFAIDEWPMVMRLKPVESYNGTEDFYGHNIKTFAQANSEYPHPSRYMSVSLPQETLRLHLLEILKNAHALGIEMVLLKADPL